MIDTRRIKGIGKIRIKPGQGEDNYDKYRQIDIDKSKIRLKQGYAK